MTPAVVGGWVGLAVTVIGLLWMLFGPIADLRADLKAMQATHVERCKFTDKRFEGLDCIVPMKLDIQHLSDQVEAIDQFCRALDPGLVKRFHSPHAPMRDALLEKMQAGTLTYDDAVRLERHVLQIIRCLHTDTRAGANDELGARLLLGRVRMIKTQLKHQRDREKSTCQPVSHS